jgi:hypothetical protein
MTLCRMGPGGGGAKWAALTRAQPGPAASKHALSRLQQHPSLAAACRACKICFETALQQLKHAAPVPALRHACSVSAATGVSIHGRVMSMAGLATPRAALGPLMCPWLRGPGSGAHPIDSASRAAGRVRTAFQSSTRTGNFPHHRNVVVRRPGTVRGGADAQRRSRISVRVDCCDKEPSAKRLSIPW